MWLLLKAELDYYKFSTLFFLLIFLGINIAFIGWGYDVTEKSYPALRSVMILTIIALLIMRQIKLTQEKMDRFYMNLPISLPKAAIMRLVFLVGFWIVIVSVFWLSYLLFAFSYIKLFILWDMTSLTGLVFSAIALPLIHRDLNLYFDGKHQKIIITALYALVIVLGYAFFMLFFIISDSLKAFEGLQPYKTIIMTVSSGVAGSLIILSIGLILLFVSTILFQKRKLYLD